MILNNVEIKARITDYDKVKRLIENVCNNPIETTEQIDTFFNCTSGRLKLREAETNSALIYYDRKDSQEPTFSDIAISFIENPDTLKTVLANSNGIRGIVKKERILYKYEQTRIHLDDVEGLGKFIELEVVLDNNQSMQDGEKIAFALMDKFNIQKSDLIDVAYIDLLERNN